MPGLGRLESREPELGALQHLHHRRHPCVLSDNDLAERIQSLGNTKTACMGVDHRELAKGVLALTQQTSG